MDGIILPITLKDCMPANSKFRFSPTSPSTNMTIEKIDYDEEGRTVDSEFIIQTHAERDSLTNFNLFGSLNDGMATLVNYTLTVEYYNKVPNSAGDFELMENFERE